MLSYANGASGTQYLNAIRFAGRWKGQFLFAWGFCNTIITETGFITGSCDSGGTKLAGNIDDAGVVEIRSTTPNAPAVTFTGVASSPAAMGKPLNASGQQWGMGRLRGTTLTNEQSTNQR